MVSKTLEIGKMKIQIARLCRQQFGRSSEKFGRIIEQLELTLDELETEAACGPTVSDSSAAVADGGESAPTRRKSPGRHPLPDNLPRREIANTRIAPAPPAVADGRGDPWRSFNALGDIDRRDRKVETPPCPPVAQSANWPAP